MQNARIDRKMRVDDLCKEARITKQTYQRLVKGSPSVSVGIVFTVMEVLSILPHHVSGEARKKPAPRRLSRGS